MTPHREDYIKAIFNYNEINQKITNKLLAESLEISPPSVSEMLSKLIEANVLMKDKDLGYKLSGSGKLEAQRLINKHRLWEVFLVEHLGYTWNQVHEDAEILEHATSNLLLERMNEFLKYPQMCPHGSIIYGNEKEGIKLELLFNVKKGQSFVIKKISEEDGLVSYLFDKRIMLDQKYMLNNKNVYDDSTDVLDTNGTIITISDKAAKKVFVEVIV